MSLKPPKKSDLGKSWMKNRRDKARMIQPEYHLIASEGTETEPQYFGAIQRIINSKYRDRIQLKVEGIGDNTVNLLMKARQYVQNNGIVFKHVWIVYDTDDFPAENIDMVAQLCEEYSTQGETIYHAVWSNQCVELWYLLHFMYMDTDIDSSRYWPKLRVWLKNIGAGSYEKNRPDRWPLHERGGALQSVGAVEWRRHAGFYLHRAHERCGERPELRCGAGTAAAGGSKDLHRPAVPLAAVTAQKKN